MMICEAWVYRGRTSTVAHLKKVFNYHHQRKSFICLVYDTGEQENDFEKNSTHYAEKIIPIADYPAGFEFNEAINVKEVSRDFGIEKSAIKVFTSVHGTGTTLYHLFVNINYKI